MMKRKNTLAVQMPIYSLKLNNYMPTSIKIRIDKIEEVKNGKVTKTSYDIRKIWPDEYDGHLIFSMDKDDLTTLQETLRTYEI